MRCEDAVVALPVLVDGSGHIDRRVVGHVGSCLHCQAELVQHRRLLRALHGMRGEVVEPHPDLLIDLLAAIEVAGDEPAYRSLLRGRRVAYVGALAAAGTAGAIALASYNRRMRLVG